MNASRSPQAASSVEDVLITQELFTRKPRLPDLAGENQALVKLAHEAAQNPRSLIQKLVEITAALCHAESAGISLLENSPNGKIFRWRAVAGALAVYQGTSTPRHACSCGVCLDRRSPQLFYRPERFFSYFEGFEPSIVEILVVPISIGRNFLGTLWAATHDESRKFEPDEPPGGIRWRRTATFAVDPKRVAGQTGTRRPHPAKNPGVAQRKKLQ